MTAMPSFSPSPLRGEGRGEGRVLAVPFTTRHLYFRQDKIEALRAAMRNTALLKALTHEKKAERHDA